MADNSISIISGSAKSGDNSIANINQWGEHVIVPTGADGLPTVVASSGRRWIEYGHRVRRMYAVGGILDLHASAYLADGFRSIVEATRGVGGCRDIGDGGESGCVGTCLWRGVGGGCGEWWASLA